jgi:hypothetical protein
MGQYGKLFFIFKYKTMKNVLMIVLLAIAGTLTAQTVSTADIYQQKGTRIQVTVINADGSRHMDYVVLAENQHYFLLTLPSGRVRYSKQHDVATQYDEAVTTKLLSNVWVKTQLVYEAGTLVMLDGAVSDGAGNLIYRFEFGE